MGWEMKAHIEAMRTRWSSENVSFRTYAMIGKLGCWVTES
jgi:hypothetical protein